MNGDVFSKNLVKVSLQSKTKDEVINELSDVLVKENRITDKQLFIHDVYEREKEVPTDLDMGVSMPHARSSAVAQASVVVGISESGIVFGESNEKSYIFIMIAMPKEATKEHITILSEITTVLLEDGNIDALKVAKSTDEVMKVFNQKGEEQVMKKDRLLLGATGCASGVAHTYLAAKALQKAAQEQGVEMKVETNGSIGVENSPTAKEIEKAECVIIASDKAVEMARFDGKKIIYAKVKDGINKADELVKRALNGEGEVYHHTASSDDTAATKKPGGIVYKALMNGVSFMIPFVVIGGIMIALAHAIGGQVTDAGLVIPEGSIWLKIADMGSVGMTLMIPILGGYIGYAIGDRAALAPGMLGGWIAANGSFYGAESGAGFLGAIAAGFIAGYVVLGIKKIKFPEAIQALVPIVIIPIIGTLVVGFAFIYIIGAPISSLMDAMYSMLLSLNGGSIIILGIVMGLMQGFDMGGPVGKTLLMFSIALMADGQNQFMGAQAMAIPVAPLGMAIATFVDRKMKFFNEEERASGKAALVMGFCGISEGAIPFAAADPIAVIPANMIGSAVAATMSLIFVITDPIAWGGPLIVALGLTNSPVLAIICMLTGSIVTAAICLGIKSLRLKRQSSNG